MMTLIAVGVALMFVVVIAGSAWQRRSRDQRAEEMASAAAALSLEYQASPGDARLGTLPPFPLLARGEDRLTANLLSGQRGGLPVRVFDFSYAEGTGSQRDRYRQTALYLDTSGKLRLPDFSLRTRTVADKVAGVIGTASVPIDLGGDFSRSYRLTGSDEGAVRALFSPSLVAFFQAHPGLNAEAAADDLLIYRYDTLVPPGDLGALLQEGEALVEALSAGR